MKKIERLGELRLEMQFPDVSGMLSRCYVAVFVGSLECYSKYSFMERCSLKEQCPKM